MWAERGPVQKIQDTPREASSMLVDVRALQTQRLPEYWPEFLKSLATAMETDSTRELRLALEY